MFLVEDASDAEAAAGAAKDGYSWVETSTQASRSSGYQVLVELMPRAFACGPVGLPPLGNGADWDYGLALPMTERFGLVSVAAKKPSFTPTPMLVGSLHAL